MKKYSLYVMQTLSAIFENKNGIDFFLNTAYLPLSKNDINEIRKKEKDILSKYFICNFISENEIQKEMIDVSPKNIPFICLDNLFSEQFKRKKDSVFFLDLSMAFDGLKSIFVPRITSHKEGKNTKTVIDELIYFIRNKQLKKISLLDTTVYSGDTVILLNDTLKQHNIAIDTVYCVFIHKNALDRLKNLNIETKYCRLLDVDIIDEHDFFVLPQSGKSFFDKGKEVKLIRFFPFGNPKKRFPLTQREAIHFSEDLLDLNIELYSKLEKINNYKFKISDLPQSIYNLPYDLNYSKDLIDFMIHVKTHMKIW